MIVEGLEISYGRFKEAVLRDISAVFDEKSLGLGNLQSSLRIRLLSS